MHARFAKAAVAIGAAVALSLTGLAFAGASPGQTVTNLDSGTVTAADLAALLVGDDTAVSNVTVTGSPQAIGTFSGFTTLGTPGGVVLSTGIVSADPTVSAVPGPNQSSGTMKGFSLPGDADLDGVLATVQQNPKPTEDAVSLEFDFVAKTTMLRFSYVFASEEYPEYVYSGVNDVFGLFVNGTNCATVGANKDPISIDTINNGYGNSGVNTKNPEFYRSNYGTSLDSVDTGFDGMTTVLTCQVAVNPGVANHVKFAIADVGDDIYDSGVFIVGGSFITDFPVPADDPATTFVDKPVTVDVLANDMGSSLVLQSVTAPTNGGKAVISNGKVTYTPPAGVSGTDTFTYTVGGVNNTTGTATVTVTIKPVATNDSATTGVGKPVTIDVLANDKGSSLGFDAAGAGQGAHGTTSIGDGKITYTPAAGFSGTDTFTYPLLGQGGTATGTVTVTVLAPPTAANDTAKTEQAKAVTIDVLANDKAATGGTITLATVAKPAHGTAVIASGKVVYTPAADFMGADTFTYTISDGINAPVTATVAVTVTGVQIPSGGTSIPSSPAGVLALVLGGLALVPLAVRRFAR